MSEAIHASEAFVSGIGAEASIVSDKCRVARGAAWTAETGIVFLGPSAREDEACDEDLGELIEEGRRELAEGNLKSLSGEEFLRRLKARRRQ